MRQRNEFEQGPIATDRAASVVEAFRRQVSAIPDAEAVGFVGNLDRDEVWRWSYAELDRRARAVAGWLAGRQAPGSRVLLLYPAGREFVAAFLGCLYAGMVAVPAPLPGQFRHHRHRVRAIAADAGAGVVLTDQASLTGVQEWSREVGLPGVVVQASDAPEVLALDGGEPVAAGRDTVTLLQYTSGSTGMPKGVVLDHGNLLHNIGSFIRAAQWAPGARSGGWLPLYHDMGLSAQLLPALLHGGACYLMAATAFVRRPEQWLRLIDECDVSVSLAPGFAYELCARRISPDKVAGLDLSRWSCAANGSEPVKAGVMADFAARFAATGFRAESFLPGYGLAEATVFVSGYRGRAPVVQQFAVDDLDAGRVRPAQAHERARSSVSCGTAESLDLRIVDPQTRRTVPEGRIGEIWIRGDSVSRGYWSNPEATGECFGLSTAEGDEGFLRTGDLGALLAGELYVQGRIKDILIVRGRNLYPHDIEHELRAQHPELSGVGAVFTVGGENDDPEELIVTHEVSNLAEEDLPALATAMTSTVAREFGVPVAAVLLLRNGTVQRTTSGKVQRVQMRELFQAGELRCRYPAPA